MRSAANSTRPDVWSRTSSNLLCSLVLQSLTAPASDHQALKPHQHPRKASRRADMMHLVIEHPRGGGTLFVSQASVASVLAALQIPDDVSLLDAAELDGAVKRCDGAARPQGISSPQSAKAHGSRLCAQTPSQRSPSSRRALSRTSRPRPSECRRLPSKTGPGVCAQSLYSSQFAGPHHILRMLWSNCPTSMASLIFRAWPLSPSATQRMPTIELNPC